MGLRDVVGAGLALLLVHVTGSARADATSDVRDIRAGKLPNRHEWLGWDAAAKAHVRTLDCSSGGTVSCRSAFVELAPDAPNKQTLLLDVVEVYCGKGEPCAALDAATVSGFVAAEKRALRTLPPTTTTPPAADPVTALGVVAGAPTRVEVSAIPVNRAELGTGVSVRLALRGKDGASETLAVLDDFVGSLDSSKVVAAYPSVDGRAAVFVATTSVTVMCWDFQHVHTVAVNVPRRRASLANTIGFRAWKKGDLAAALSAFFEATTVDPTFALGWYNRAAVESRTGAVPLAAKSFREATALDPGSASRACRDKDFDALRAAEPTLFRCGR